MSINAKYDKWAELEKECEAEEAAEQAAKKRERDAHKAKMAEAGHVKPQDMEQAYSQAFDKNKADMKITQEEEHKFKTAFKDPKFRTLMDDYMEEISDPKHRAEQNAYIKQLEADGKTPEGKEFMEPEAGFAVKTRKDDKDKTKIFCNIVHCDRVEKATVNNTDKGAQWSLPYTLGPLRQEKDKGGALVPAIDCCYATETLARANRDPRFKKMIVNTALDAVEAAFKSVQHQDVKLDRNYHVVKGLAYKNGKPVTMMLNKDSTNSKFPNASKAAQDAKAQKAAAERAAQEEEVDPMAATADELNDDVDDLQSRLNSIETEAAKSHGESEPEKKPKTVAELHSLLTGLDPEAQANQEKELTKPKKKTKPMKGGFIAKQMKREESKKKKRADKRKKRDGPEKPAYKIVERGSFDMAKFLQNDLLHYVSSKQRPKEIVAHITLPLLKSAATVELDVSERKLIVGDEKNYYHLDVFLPHPVIEDGGSAKFDKVKRILSVTMPVQPLSEEAMEQIKEEASRMHQAQMAVKEMEGAENPNEDAEGGDGESENDPTVSHTKDGVVGIPWTKQEKAERKKKMEADALAGAAKDTAELDAVKDHGTWMEREKQPTLMRATTKQERDKKQTQERWVPHEDETAVDEVQVAIKKAKQELKKHKKRQAALKEKALEDQESRIQQEKAMKMQAMKKAALQVKKIGRRPLYDDAPAPAYIFKQNANTVTLIIKVSNVSEDTLLFETPDDRSVSLVFSSFAPAADGDCEEVEHMHKLKFHTFAAMDVASCTYKLATRNMVVVLAKKEKGEKWESLEGDPNAKPLLPAIEPRVMFKQNDTAATLLLQVSGVVEDSVVVSFETDKVEVRFIGDIDARDLEPVGDNDDAVVDLEEYGDDAKRPYKLVFTPCGSVIPEQCTFKVASRNMVVKLGKQDEGKEWGAMKAAKLFIVAVAYEGSKEGYVFKMGPNGLGYYKDTYKEAAKAAEVAKAVEQIKADNENENGENAGATNNSSTEQKKQGTIGFDNGGSKSQKESQGSIDSGSVTLVNQIMYELD